MIDYFFDTLRHYPELSIFLALGLGYFIGAVKFGSFTLGAVTGTLLAGVLIGQVGIDVSPQVKSLFFLMFLFAVGYGVGPQFVRGVASDGAPQALFAVVICLLCLGCVYVAAKVAGYGPGLAAGLLAGAQTISASIGVATDAINNLGMDPAQAKAELNSIPVAYAICYLFGTIGTGWILAYLGPTLLGIDVAKECARYELQMKGGNTNADAASAWHQHEMRAYLLDADSRVVGKTVAQAEGSFRGERLFVENIRRGQDIIDPTPEVVLQAGDVVAVSATYDVLSHFSNDAEDVNDRDLLDVPVETVSVQVTNGKVANRQLDDLATEPFTRGVYINGIKRGSLLVDIPVLPKTALHRGDIISVTGTKKHTDALIKAIGFADRPITQTSMVMVGLAIVLGGLIGALKMPVHGIPITLSTSGGVLIAGIVFGWLRSFLPSMGAVPAATLWFMNSVGLNVFIAVVGISAGPTFIKGLQEAGVSIFLWGLFATAVPMLVAPFIGKYIFKFDPAINLGCCGGARTSTASVAMVGEVAKSNVPMLGYTVPYAVSNTLLTLWGLAIVLLIAH
ncbi:aspartate-alanine antiporter [Ottowia sp.]|uniref:aspartate-alanine antiporter n=1 Tax=Ottowia sp. TaxID=1898956 RepID=UPI003A8432AB